MKKFLRKIIFWIVKQCVTAFMHTLQEPQNKQLQKQGRQAIEWMVEETVHSVKQTFKNQNTKETQEWVYKFIHESTQSIAPVVVKALQNSQKDNARILFNQLFLRYHLMQEWLNYINPHLHTAVINPPQLKEYTFQRISTNGMFLEFGVGLFFSIRYFSRLLQEQFPNAKIYGFDTFEGLPEDWTGTSMFKGGFKTQIPDNIPENVSLIKGNVLNTFALFLKHHPEPIAFMHLDLDLYKGTKWVLDTALKYKRIVPGTLLIFDEFFGNLGCAAHERKAFHEWIPQLKEQNLSYKFVAFTYEQAVVKIIKK